MGLSAKSTLVEMPSIFSLKVAVKIWFQHSKHIKLMVKVLLTPLFLFAKTNLLVILNTSAQKVLIQINPRFSVPDEISKIAPKHAILLHDVPSLRRMGPAAVMTSTQEDRISPVLSFPWGWCKTYSNSAQKRFPEALAAAAAISQI